MLGGRDVGRAGRQADQGVGSDLEMPVQSSPVLPASPNSALQPVSQINDQSTEHCGLGRAAGRGLAEKFKT